MFFHNVANLVDRNDETKEFMDFPESLFSTFVEERNYW
jgi:hypothetical protein